MREIFNDGVMKATLLRNNWVVVEWLTNKVGHLSKTVVKDLHKLETFIIQKKLMGWVLGSEIENTDMHKLIERFGGKLDKEVDGYKIYYKGIKLCVEQPK